MIEKLLRCPTLTIRQLYSIFGHIVSTFFGTAEMEEASLKSAPQFESATNARMSLAHISPVVSPPRETSHTMTPKTVLVLVALQQLSVRPKSTRSGLLSKYWEL